MEKLGFFTTLLVAGSFIAGCSFHFNINNTSSTVDGDKPSISTESGRLFACNEEVGKHYHISTFGGGWDTEDEAGASYVLMGEITYEKKGETIVKNVECVVDMVDNSVSILEVEEPVDEVPDDFDGCNNYFDGCNRCALQDDGEIVCTKKACLEYEEAYCADDESLEDVDQFQESDIVEGGGERITVVSDMCKEQGGEVDNKDGSEICIFGDISDDNRCYLDELADGSCRNEKKFIINK